MQIEWPKKRNCHIHIKFDSTCRICLQCDEANITIDACKEAYDKAQGNGLVALDKQKLDDFIANWVVPMPPEAMNTHMRLKKEIVQQLSKDLYAKFGQPSPTPGKWKELDYKEVVKITDHYMGVTGNSDLCASRICQTFATKTDLIIQT